MNIIDSSEYEAVEFGEPYQYDENFHGVETKRKCTDFCMTIVFILFFCSFLSLFFAALAKSNYKYIYIPTDHRGLMCGYDNRLLKVSDNSNLPDLTNKKYLFWVRPGTPGYSRSFCVEKCPTVGLFIKTVINFNNSNSAISKIDEGFEKDHICYSYTSKNGSIIDVKATIENYSSINTNRYFCPYSTSKVIERCIPNTESFDTTAEDLKDQIHKIGRFSSNFRDISIIIQAIEDIYKARWTIIVCVIIAFVMTILWLTALRCLAAFVIWLTVILAGASLGLLTYSLFKQWRADFESGDLIKKYITRYFFGELNSKFLYATFWVMVLFDILYIFMVFRMIKKINKSCKVIGHAAKLFGKKPSLFIFTALHFLLLFCWWIFVVFCFVVLFGTGIPERKFEKEGNTVVDKIERRYESYVNFFIFYFILALLCISLFISYLEKTTIYGVLSQCYFTRMEDNYDHLVFCVCKTYYNTLKYHSGSVAFGSILIWIVKPIRALSGMVYSKTHSSNDCFSKFLKYTCCCCIFCYRKCLVYLNANAFIMVAMHGYNFVCGAKNAFNLVMRNKINILLENWVGTFALYIGRLFISILVTATASWLLNSNEELQFFVAPGLVIFICSYVATGVFTGVIDDSIDSMFICFMEDRERNDGVVHEMFASKGLQKFIQTNNRVSESADSALLNNVMIQPKEN